MIGTRLQAIAIPTAPGVLHAKEWGVTWGQPEIEELKTVALGVPARRARLCLHPSKEAIHQEMVIVVHKDAVEVPQRRSNGPHTKIALEGTANIELYSADGRLIRVLGLGGQGSRYFRTIDRSFHRLVGVTEWFVFIEILRGPFVASTTERAAWFHE